MKRIMITAVAIAAMAAVSCEKEAEVSISGKTIKASIRSAEMTATKSGHEAMPESRVISSQYIGETEDCEYYLEVIETEGIQSRCGFATKTATITTDNFQTAGVDAFLDIQDGFVNSQGIAMQSHYIDGGILSADGTVTAGGEPCYWVNNVQMHMWCHAGADFTSSKNGLSFDYDATSDRSDVITSYNRLMYKDGASDFASVQFHHALSGIRFDFRLLNASLKVTEVTISGLGMAGTCNVTASGNTWTMSSDPSKKTFQVSKPEGFAPLQEQGDCYFLIPQQLQNATISMSFTNMETQVSTVKTIPLTNTWVAGNTYTYKVKASIKKTGSGVEINGDRIEFRGSADSNIMYSQLKLPRNTFLKLDWGYEMGNTKDGRVVISVVRANGTQLNLYDRTGYKGGVLVAPKKLSEQCKEFTGTHVLSGSSDSGNCSMIISLEDLGLAENEKFDIKFEYFQSQQSGNANARWIITSLDLQIIDDYTYPYLNS